MMIEILKRLAAMAAGFVVLVATPALAEPAMWVIKDEDSTIYLFGTVHVLKKDTVWRTDKVAKALGSADDLWLEVDEGDDPNAIAGLMMQIGMDPSTSLSSLLDEDQKRRLQATAGSLGMPAGQLDGMKPWMAGLTLSVLPMIQAGYNPAFGVDGLLRAEAKAGGKQIRAFETAEQQIRFFDNLARPVQIAFLMSAVDEAGEGAALLDGLVAAWSTGNVGQLESLMIASMDDEYPEVYEALIINRNIAWADALKARLAGSGVSFVAVGAGHLVGPDSLQVQLAKLGIQSSRY